MRILAIDYGTKRIGLAKWSSAADVVLPFGLVGNVGEVADLIRKENIDKVIVGLPLGLDGAENENTKRIRRFAEELREKIKIKNKVGVGVELFDERFTSQIADRMEAGVSRDEKAAMVLLQSFLDHAN